jgi:hypothetical protein
VLLFVSAVGAFVTYDRLIVAPERRRVILRYNEFRTVVASGDYQGMLRFVAPESREWAATRLHLYEAFAIPLEKDSTVSVHFGEATICPKPVSYFLLIPGGNVIKMAKRDGEWMMGHVYID